MKNYFIIIICYKYDVFHYTYWNIYLYLYLELDNTEDNAPHRSHRLPHKVPSAKCRIPSLELLVRCVLETPKTTQAIATCLS